MRNKGQALVELLIAIGLSAIIIPALLGGFALTRNGRAQQDQRLQAAAYLKEAQEAVGIVQSNGWNNLANGTFHPIVSGSTWMLAAGAESINNNFTRQIVISDVYRDANGNIIPSGGDLDNSTKKITTTVSWTLPSISSIDSITYLSRYRNASYLETLASSFNSGTLTSTQVTNVSGGEVALGNNNKAKWCAPAFSPSTIDLPDGPPVAVDALSSATSSAIPNDVFVATAPYATSSIKMAFVNVTADLDPPVASLHGIFTLDSSKYSPGKFPSNIGIDNNFKTNDIKYYESPSGFIYALLATNLSDKEVIALQVKNAAGDAFQDPVNKIYKYWTYFNTKIYSTAFNSPSAHSAETNNAGDNNGFQSNSANAYINDGLFAVDTNSGSNTGTNCTGSDKDKHRYYNYGFSIPTGATINGIEMSLVAKVDNTSGNPKMCVQLSWDGGSTWTTAKSTSNLTIGSAAYTLGGPADIWGRSWSDANFTNTNFRVRIIDLASNNSRDFSLDWAGVKVYYNDISSIANDQEPFGYGAKSITVIGSKGYVSSGGYLYTFDLSNIDTKTSSSPLDQMGCRIQLDGYDCNPGTGTDRKYSAGEIGASWSDTTSPAHNDCSDGGNVELYANNDLYGVQVGGSNYIYVAVGAGTNPEFEIVNATNVPDVGSNPAISSISCGRISGGNAAWKVVGSLDFNSDSNTEEAANSVFSSTDGSRAYISSNGGIDGDHNGIPDSDQFYIINTSNKSSPSFLTGTPSTGAQSGYYNGNTANIQMYPRRSLTVLNGDRVVLVGKDAINDSNNAQEYQVLNNANESTPTYCGGVNFDQGLNDLTSVSEADGDNFVYMVANTQDKQLKIIQGGADNAVYVASGIFESQTFNAGGDAMFNRFSTTTNTPTQTSISYQVAISHAISGSCNGVTYNYVGPDGTANTFFTSSSELPRSADGSGYENTGQCMRYKVFMTSANQLQTPTLFDFSVNYSP